MSTRFYPEYDFMGVLAMNREARALLTKVCVKLTFCEMQTLVDDSQIREIKEMINRATYLLYHCQKLDIKYCGAWKLSIHLYNDDKIRSVSYVVDLCQHLIDLEPPHVALGRMK